MPVKGFRQENHELPAFSEMSSEGRIENRLRSSKRKQEYVKMKISRNPNRRYMGRRVDDDCGIR